MAINDNNCTLKGKRSNTIAAVISTNARKAILPKPILTICYFCRENRSDLPTHLLKHTREKHFKCAVCNLRFKLLRLKRIHISSKHPNAFTCNIKRCTSTFRTQPEYLDHVRNKHDGPFKCPFDECGSAKLYKKKRTLSAHIEYHHQGGRERRMKTHKCLLCNKEYASRIGLRTHERVSHENQPKTNICMFCQKGFIAKGDMTRHVNVVHLGQKEFTKCTQPGCHLVFNCPSSMRNHKRKVHQNLESTRFKCQETACTKTFTDASNLRAHVKFVHKEETRPRNQICKLCNVGFPTYNQLEGHIAVIHTGEKPYRCEREGCSKTFHTWPALASHVKGVHLSRELGIRFKCDKCPSSFRSKYSLVYHREEKHLNLDPAKEKEFYPCYFCQEKKSTKTSLQEHIRWHTGERPFRCYECGIDFRKSTQLQSHNLRQHDKDNPKNAKIPCPLCGKLIFRQSVRQHILFVHKKNRPHKCTPCDKKFAAKASVVHHMRITHLGQRIMLECPEQGCSKQFKSPSGLQRHRKGCHPSATDPTEYPCRFCFKIYKNSNSLASHVYANHKYGPNNLPHRCNLCGKSYLQIDKLMGHISYSHTNERGFKCDRCEKAFGCKTHLYRHKKIHRNQEAGRNYPYTQCPSVFTNSRGLECHISTKHVNISHWNCYFCGKQTNFDSPTTISHIQRHTKEKPQKYYEC